MMKQPNILRIGSRESRLAVLQAEIVMQAIRRAHPQLKLELVTMKTTGDRFLDRSLESLGGKGVFVKELDLALAQGRIDLAVHSLKDMPLQQPEGLPILAFSKREDPRDALVLPLEKRDPQKPVGCSSLRRQLQLKALLESGCAPVRGNILTRLEKLDRGEYSALVLAAAGLKRAGLQGRVSRYFSPEELLPAAGQGILAVQGRAGEWGEVLACIHDRDAADAAAAERAFIRALDGGCTSPVAAYAQPDGGQLCLTGLYVPPGGEECFRQKITGPREEAARLGETLALEMKRRYGP